jgi:hypothetical protein
MCESWRALHDLRGHLETRQQCHTTKDTRDTREIERTLYSTKVKT